jgi:hypothetical protein
MAPLITATMADSFPTGFDVDLDNKADPGDKIRYTATINNAGPDTATGPLHFSGATDANTTFVPGSVVISPLAINETYASIGNMTLTSANLGASCGANSLRSVLCNDTPSGGTLTGFGNSLGTANGTVVNGTNTVTTTNGGTVLLNTDGTFVYNPGAGFEGADSFFYTLTNSTVTPNLSDTGQVTINLGGANGMVWFINNNAASTNVGTQANPFTTLATFNGLNNGTGNNPNNGDTIFLFESGTNYSAPVTLRLNQKFIGQDATASIPTLGGPALPSNGGSTNGNTYPAINPTGTAVTIDSPSSGITLNSGNTLSGFTVANTGTAAGNYDIANTTTTTVGTLFISQVTLSGTGGLFRADAGGALNVTFTSATTTSAGSSAFHLTNVTGSFTSSAGAISGVAGADVLISGGSAAISIANTITNTAGRSVDIQSRSGNPIGLVSFTAAINDTGAGIFLDNNDLGGGTGTISFTGGVTLSTTTNPAFTATNGGIVNVTGAANDITTTSGVGVNINGDTIGASGVTFRNITVSAGAANGIVLSSTSGNFTASAPTLLGTNLGSGPTGTGINIANYATGTISFNTVNIQERGNTGISIDNFDGTSATFAAITIPNQNDAGGYGIRVINSTAPVTIASATISDAHTLTVQTDGDTNNIPDSDGDGDSIFLKTNTGTFTLNGGTLLNSGNDGIDGRAVQNIILNDVTINNPGQENGGQGVGGHGISLIDVSGTSNWDDVLITQFGRSQTDGARAINTNINGTLNITDCRFENTFAAGASAGNDGLFVESRGSSAMTLLVDEVDGTSKFKGLFGEAIQFSTGNPSTGLNNVTVTDTEFVDAYIGSTQTGSGHNGLRTHGVGAGDIVVDIQNNTFTNVAVPLFQQGVISLFTNFNASVKGTVKNNVITNATQAGIQLFCDNVAGETITEIDVNIESNTINNTSGQGILVNLGSGGSVAEANVRINSNNIGQAVGGSVGDGEVLFGFGGAAFSSQEGVRIEVFGSGAKTVNLRMNGNNVRSDAVGVNTTFPPANEALQIAVSQNATLNATVTNNQLLQLDDTTNGAAFFGQTFAGSPIGSPTMCLDFTGNTGNTAVDFFLSESAGNFSIENVAGVVGANTGVWSPANPSASGYANSGGCTEPPVNVAKAMPSNSAPKDYLATVSPSVESASAPRPWAAISIDPIQFMFTQTTAPVVAENVTHAQTQIASHTSHTQSAAQTLSHHATSKVTARRDESAAARSHADEVRIVPASSSSDEQKRSDRKAVNVKAARTATSVMTPMMAAVEVDLPDLPAGESIKVVFDVTVDSRRASYSAQGTVTATSHAPVLTDDDPGTAAPNEPTITPGDCTNTITVTNNLDSTAGSLRQALTDVCEGGTINFDGAFFATPRTIDLLTGLTIDRDVTINGPAALLTVRRSTGAFRVFTLTSGNTVAISSMTIADGIASGAFPAHAGGGIYNDHSILTLTNVTVSGNTANSGGGVYNDGQVSGSASLTIINSTISGNTATADGGAVWNNGTTSGSATLNVTNSTISGNNANFSGGGICNVGTGGTASVTITNATITNNRSDNDNNGVGGGGGILASTGPVTLRNSIVQGNFNEDGPTDAADDISGAMNGGGNSTHNRIGTCASCALSDGTDNNELNVTAAEINLGLLALNGGPTQTHALGSGSIALDTGNNAYVTAPPFLVLPATDQRGPGFLRIRDAADALTTQTVDIGAFEADPSVEDITDKATNEDVALPVFVFNLGDSATPGALTITATSGVGDQTLVPNANIIVGADTPSTRTLTITPAPNQFGAATITVTVTRGAQSMSDTFVLTVNAINDPPSFTLPGNPPSVGEDAGATTVNGYATSISQGPNETGQTLTFNVTANGTTGTLAFTAPPAIDGTTGNLTYTPTGNTNGTATFNVTLSDNGSNTPPNSNTSGIQSFTITVNAVNDAPVLLTGATPVLSSVNEDAPAPVAAVGTLVSTLVDLNPPAGGLDNVTDADSTPVTGIAVTGVVTTDGTWFYTVDGGTNWFAMGPVTDDAARFLAADLNTRIYFQPTTPGFNGVISNALTFRAWDTTSGSNGGTGDPSPGGLTTAFSTASDSANITVNDVNATPVINDLAGDTSTFTEDGPAVVLDDSSVPELATTVTDDQADLNGGNLTVSTTVNGVPAEDVLGISIAGTVTLSSGTNVTSIVSVGGVAIGTVTANGTGGNNLVVTFNSVNATPARISTLMQALTYFNSNIANPSTLQRTIAVSVNDGGTSDSENVFVNITSQNDTPALDLDANNSSGAAGANYSTGYAALAPAVPVTDTDVTVTDVDDTNMESATVTLTNVQANDSLTVNGALPGGITLNGLSTTSNIILNGSASKASYQTALRQIEFSNSNASPNLTPRNITSVVNDGDINSNTATTTITICVNSPVVTSIANSGAGSLRQAILDACPGSTITFNTAGVFATPQTITLATELVIDKNLTIDGPDAAGNHVTVSGGGVTRVLRIEPLITATIRELTISNGQNTINGAGIYNFGTLTITNSTISGNTAANSGNGGGIYSDTAATLTVTNSTISGNIATGSGGGIFSLGLLSLTNSTLSGNKANSGGGGLLTSSGVATLTNLTITNNTCDADDASGGNGGGATLLTGVDRLRNTIVAGNFNGTASPVADDLFGAVDTSAASHNNLIGTTNTGLTNGVNGNQVGVANPLLDSLQNNGGPTFTHALLYNSPAVDKGSDCVFTNTCVPSLGAALTTDQRGSARQVDGDLVAGAVVDIGAYERQDPESRAVAVGAPVNIDLNDVQLTFPSVTVGGTATIEVLDPDAQGPAPGGISIGTFPQPPGCAANPSQSDCLPAFNVSTTSTYTGPVGVCFYLPAITDPAFFGGLKILHDGGVGLVDVTTGKNFPNKLLCGSLPSLSPFVIGFSLTPTASDGNVSGQILDNNGNPVEGAAVRMTGTQNRLTVTDAAGHYNFDDVDTNGFYTVVPSRANFAFSPTQRAFTQQGQNTNAAFTATLANAGLNPLDTTVYFVRQQYVDFLGREPDEAGLNFWVNNIESCGSDAPCREAKRIDTSAAFFLSIEFQETGYLVYRMYATAYGDKPGSPVPLERSDFGTDAAAISNGVVVLKSGWETVLENNKHAYAALFVQRPRFVSAYPGELTPTEFVDRLFTSAGVTPSVSERAAAINEFRAAATSVEVAARGRALRRVAENGKLVEQEFNQAFVLMEYFGYLRRNPSDAPERTLDYAGYNFWLSKLNTFNGNFRNAEMVKAFLSSIEYRERFPR